MTYKPVTLEEFDVALSRGMTFSYLKAYDFFSLRFSG